MVEALALGVDVAPRLPVDRTQRWEEWEIDIIREYAADMNAICRLLPLRSRNACRQKRLDLGFVPKVPPWTTSEERILRANYLKVSRTGELLPLLPGRSRMSISAKLHAMGLLIPPPAPDTGSAVVDAIKMRCRLLGYTMADLDRMAGTVRYFQKRKYKQGRREADGRYAVTQVSPAMARAVQALGGTFLIEWPDGGECIDAIDVGEG